MKRKLVHGFVSLVVAVLVSVSFTACEQTEDDNDWVPNGKNCERVGHVISNNNQEEARSEPWLSATNATTTAENEVGVVLYVQHVGTNDVDEGALVLTNLDFRPPTSVASSNDLPVTTNGDVTFVTLVDEGAGD